MDWGSAVTSLGTTVLKGKQVTFGIKDDDRLKHVSVLGSAGSGRGDFIARMALQDSARSLGVVVLDAKGNVAPRLMERFDGALKDRLIYLDPSDAEHPFSWNILDDVRALKEEEREKWMVRILEGVYQLGDSPLLQAVAQKLLRTKEASLVTLYHLVAEPDFRKSFYKDDPEGLEFFTNTCSEHSEVCAQIEEHGRYLAKDTLMRNLLGQHTSKLSFHSLLKGGIIIVNFENIRMFPTRMTPLVRLFTEATLMVGETSGRPPALYIQDSLRYLGEKEIDRAFDCRGVALTVADTIIKETDLERRERALARSGSIISFATHRLDRPLIERAFYPFIEPEELEALPSQEFVATLVVDGVRTRPFSGVALPLLRARSASYQDLIIENRARYTELRSEIDALFDDDDDEPTRPGGFQDAFRTMFERRARAGAVPTPPQAPKPPQSEPGTQGVPIQEMVRQHIPSTPKESRRDPHELAEDVLKQLVYVPAIS